MVLEIPLPPPLSLSVRSKIVLPFSCLFLLFFSSHALPSLPPPFSSSTERHIRTPSANSVEGPLQATCGVRQIIALYASHATGNLAFLTSDFISAAVSLGAFQHSGDSCHDQ